MKIAYITQNPVTISETFFSFLVKGLEEKVGSKSLIHVVGSKAGNKLVERTLFTNFVLNFLGLRLLYEFEERSGLNTDIALHAMQRTASRRLKKMMKYGRPDVAHVEYGNTAIKVYRFLADNNIPFIVHYHGKDASSEFISSTYLRESKKIFDKAAYIVTASEHVKRLLVIRGCDPEKIRMIRYGIEVEKMTPVPWSDRFQGDPSIVFLGRLTEKKNPIALLHAFKLVLSRVPNAKLSIIGRGKLEGTVRERIEKLGLSSSVRMYGALNQEEALKVVNQHWVFAQHNVSAVDGDQEGYSLAPAEAAALEIPVVSTLHNGIPEHVIDGTTGYLVREFDYETMADKIADLLQDHEKMVSFGKAGRQNIRKLNDPERRLTAMYQLLEEACNKHQVADPIAP